MSRIYAVIRTRGGAWKEGVPVEQQYDFNGHMDYIRKLHDEGFIVHAGGLDNSNDALLIVRAEDEGEIKRKLEWDSWTANDLLRTIRVAPWTVRVGSIEGK
jgi:uncharacterized protein YciI